MTALAMIIGMVPMAFGLGDGGEQNAPLGRAVIGGLLLATVATLVFVPAVFCLLHGGRAAGAVVATQHGGAGWRPIGTSDRMPDGTEVKELPPAEVAEAGTKPARHRRWTGIVIAAIAVLALALGILRGIEGRKQAAATLAETTREDAVPTVAVVHPQPRRAGAGAGAAGQHGRLYQRADLCADQRLPEGLVLRYRRPREAGRPAGRDRDTRTRPAVAPGARATCSDASGTRAVAGKHGTCQSDDRPLLGAGSPGLDEPAAGRPGPADLRGARRRRQRGARESAGAASAGGPDARADRL